MWSGFDVAAVLRAPGLTGAAVLAGSAGLDRAVSRVRVVSVPDELLEVTAAELVITSTGTLGAPAEPAAGLVERLVTAGAAGLAVVVGWGEALGGDLLAAAERMALPTVTFPEGTGLDELANMVLEAVLGEQERRLQHVLDTQQRFAGILAAGGGAAEVAEALHELVGRPVAVLDAAGRPVVVVPPGASVDDGRGGPATFRQEIRAGDHTYGFVAVQVGAAVLDTDGVVAVEHAALGLAARLAQAAAVGEAQERFAAISLEELISGHSPTVADAVERAATFGWDLNRPRAVLLASIDPPEGGGPVPAGALGTLAAAARATLGPDAIVWTRATTVAALVAPGSDDPGDRRVIAERLRADLDDRLRSVTVSIGVGRRVASPMLLPRSFTEASRAVEVGRWAKGRHVTEVFDQLGLERLLASTPPEDLDEFVQGAIGKLVEHDRAHRTDLVRTLEVWLETRNMAEASRRMFVHYNTLKNRLDRIEALIGPVLTDAARALECEVALYVARHYQRSSPR